MRLVFVAIALVVLSMAFVQVLDAGIANAGEETTISGESFDPQAGQVQSLQYSNIDGAYYDDQVTVENSSGDPSVEGADYEWFESNGTIKPLAGGNLEGETSATIDYELRQPSETQRGFTAMLSNIPSALPWVAVVLFAIALVSAMRGL